MATEWDKGEDVEDDGDEVKDEDDGEKEKDVDDEEGEDDEGLIEDVEEEVEQGTEDAFDDDVVLGDGFDREVESKGEELRVKVLVGVEEAVGSVMFSDLRFEESLEEADGAADDELGALVRPVSLFPSCV